MAFGERAASGAAKAQGRDRPVGQSSVGELIERGCTPAVAAQAVQLQGVVAGQQVGDGVQVNGGGHPTEGALNAGAGGEPGPALRDRTG